jgi:hypothetical protein
VSIRPSRINRRASPRRHAAQAGPPTRGGSRPLRAAHVEVRYGHAGTSLGVNRRKPNSGIATPIPTRTNTSVGASTPRAIRATPTSVTRPATTHLPVMTPAALRHKRVPRVGRAVPAGPRPRHPPTLAGYVEVAIRGASSVTGPSSTRQGLPARDRSADLSTWFPSLRACYESRCGY